MVANPGKFQIMFLGSNIDNSEITFMIENKRVKSRSEVKLFGNTMVIYEMEDPNFEDLLLKDSSWLIHENNIHTLLIELYKSLNHISSPIMQVFFDLKVTPYSLRNKNILRLPRTNTS